MFSFIFVVFADGIGFYINCFGKSLNPFSFLLLTAPSCYIFGVGGGIQVLLSRAFYLR